MNFCVVLFILFTVFAYLTGMAECDRDAPEPELVLLSSSEDEESEWSSDSDDCILEEETTTRDRYA